MVNSKQKGSRGEREGAEKLRSLGFTKARRGQQYQGSPESPDIVGGIPGTHCEVKRVEKLQLYAALEQALSDCGPQEIPYVLHRRNRKPWVVIVRADDLIELAMTIVDSLGPPPTEGKEPPPNACSE